MKNTNPHFKMFKTDKNKMKNTLCKSIGTSYVLASFQ